MCMAHSHAQHHSLFFTLQEKLDHLGIVVLIIGTPITALMVSCQLCLPHQSPQIWVVQHTAVSGDLCCTWGLPMWCAAPELGQDSGIAGHLCLSELQQVSALPAPQLWRSFLHSTGMLQSD